MTAGEVENPCFSRKRGFDEEEEAGPSKRSFTGLLDAYVEQGDSNDAGMLHIKILVPSPVAGAIIGKGGETIAQLQREKGATIRMSKANDFYPGTTDRVCIIWSANYNSVLSVVSFIVSKFSELGNEHQKQLKILVTNLIAGKVIGKGGTYIKQLQDDSGATIQISQKSDSAGTPERIVTVTGDEQAIGKAVEMVLAKVQEAPSSVSNLNLTYTGSNLSGEGRPVEGVTKMTGLGSLIVHLKPEKRPTHQPLVDLVLAGLPSAYASQGYPYHVVAELSSALSTLSQYGMLSIDPNSTPVKPTSKTVKHNVPLQSSQNGITSPYAQQLLPIPWRI